MFLSVPENTIWKLDNENILVVMILSLKRNISIFVMPHNICCVNI